MAAAFGLLFVVLMSLIILVSGAFYNNELYKQRRSLVELTANTAVASIHYVQFSGKHRVQLVIEQMLDEESLAYIEVLDEAGQRVAHSDPARLEEPLIEGEWMGALAALEGQGRFTRERLHAGRQVTEVFEQIQVGFEGQTPWVVRVGVYTESRGDVLRRAAPRIGSLLVLTLVVAVMGVYLLSRRLSAPINQQARELERIMDFSPLLIAITDPQGVVLRGSHEFYERLGVAEEDHPRLDALLPELAGGEAAGAVREEIEVSIGDARRVLMVARFLMNPARPETSLRCMIAADITEQHQTERERDRLEALLRQSQKLEAVGLLAGGVAHDFNNLLTIIGLNAEMIEFAAPEGSPVIERAASITSAADSATALTKQLLAFSRRQVLAIEAIDLNAVILGIGPMLKRLISEQITLSYTPQEALWPVSADVGQMEQVVMNLVINARDAMPDGGMLTITSENRSFTAADLRDRPEVEPGDYALLTVSDTGQGIPAEILPRILEPFFTTKELGQGTGLGLSTIHGIVRQHKGHIWIYSEPGVGTTFRVALPRLHGEVVLPREPERAVDPPGGDEVILVVEDDQDVRGVIASILQDAGYTTYEASDGVDALEKLPGLEPQPVLVISDMIMPRMKGHELAARLRASDPGLRVLFLSGYSEEVVLDKVDLGDIELVQKPPSVRQLRAAVRRTLDR